MRTFPKFCAFVQPVIVLEAVQLISGDHMACAVQEVTADHTLIALNDVNMEIPKHPHLSILTSTSYG